MSQTFDSPDKDPRQFDETTSGGRQDKPAQGNKEGRDQKQTQNPQLSPEDVPDSSNESRGTTGSGQRQDSN